MLTEEQKASARRGAARALAQRKGVTYKEAYEAILAGIEKKASKKK